MYYMAAGGKMTQGLAMADCVLDKGLTNINAG